MIIFAVALAAVVAVVVALSDLLAEEETASEQAASVEPVSSGAEPKKREFDPGEKLEIEGEPPEEPLAAEPEVRDEAQKTPVTSDGWPEPSGEEVAAAEAPRHYAPRRDSSLALTVEAIGLHDVPVTNASSQQALDGGVIHFPQTPMPWDERPQKNVYLAGHRLGWPGTGSRLVFYNLDKLRRGDPIMLRDSLGNPYEYRVSEVFVVRPDADWAVDPVRGRDMLTLQTCTLPDLRNRIIVRADHVRARRARGGVEKRFSG